MLPTVAWRSALAVLLPDPDPDKDDWKAAIESLQSPRLPNKIRKENHFGSSGSASRLKSGQADPSSKPAPRYGAVLFEAEGRSSPLTAGRERIALIDGAGRSTDSAKRTCEVEGENKQIGKR